MAALDAARIRYLLVGGIAVGIYAEPRFTKDLDILVAVDDSNVSAFMEALRSFGAPVHLVEPSEFLEPDFIFYFGVAPWRIDILTTIPGVDFEEAYRRRTNWPLLEYQASVISKEDLIRAKEASGRLQDLLDLESLRRTDDKP